MRAAGVGVMLFLPVIYVIETDILIHRK